MPVIVRKQNRSKKLRPYTRRAGAFLLPFSPAKRRGNGLLLHGVEFYDLIFVDTIRTHKTVFQFWKAVLLIFE